MKLNLPDPVDVAKAEAEQLAKRRFELLERPVERVLTDCPRATREELLAGLLAFHREAMSKAPPRDAYPESPPWVDHILAVDRELQRQAGLSELELAQYRSLQAYLTFRGYLQAAPLNEQGVEKCRAAYLPESNRGAAQIKNIDDPPTFHRFRDLSDLAPKRHPTLGTDGVGSGMHIDDEPEQIFPLEPRRMFSHYADDVPGAIEFLRRYSPFWGGGNFLVYDDRKRSAAIEKCSRNFFEVFEPNAHGVSHISGMTCRDPDSPQGRHQQAKRDQYCALYGIGDDGSDRVFWSLGRQFENKLAAGLDAMGAAARIDDLIALFTNPWPDGLNKGGTRFHPEQGLVGYTLEVTLFLFGERRLLHWTREEQTLAFPAQPLDYVAA